MLRNGWVCLHYQRPENSRCASISKDFLSERLDLLLFKNVNYTKTKHGINKQNMTCILFNVLMPWHIWNFPFEVHDILVCHFSIQVNGEENFKQHLFVTEARSLGVSVGIFINHTDNYILRHIFSLKQLPLFMYAISLEWMNTSNLIRVNLPTAPSCCAVQMQNSKIA